MSPSSNDRRSTLSRRIDTALGKNPADLVLKNVRVLDVFRGEWREADVAVQDGFVVGVDPGYRGRREIEARGKWLVPGFLDAHVHLESSLMAPGEFERVALRCGTTAAVCDPHELANVMGVSGIDYFLRASETMALDLRVMLSSCVPATHLETNGGGTLAAKDLLPLRAHPKALGLAEMMNFPGVLGSDPDVLEKIAAFEDVRMDGHAPMVRGKALSAYASCGISSCHESSELDEATEKLSKGVAVWIREGSVAKDLDRLIPLLTAESSASLGFCTDDRNPLDILDEGHIDHLVRAAIARGAKPEWALRAASWSVARHYGLDRGPDRQGAIAPGYRADFILLDDLRSVRIAEVFRGGRPVSEMDFSSGAGAGAVTNSIRSDALSAEAFAAPKGRVHVIEAEHGKILTGRSVKDSSDPGVSLLAVKERYGKGRAPATGYVSGFGALRGAIASSVGHDSHNLIAVGSDPKDLAVAMNALRASGGGFCVVRDGAVAAKLDLPFGGLMTSAPAESIRKDLIGLKAASRSIGCGLPEPFLQLAFLSLPVIPSLKLTDRGLVDVDRFELVSVGA